jgi:nucleoside-diphosphate-sugar epimerase
VNVLIGVTGFIGGHLVEYLFQQGEISKGTFRKGAHLKIMDNSGVQSMEADILDHHSLHEAMEGADTVYNLASPTPASGPKADYEAVNTEGLRNLTEVAMESGVKKIVHLSTLDVYGFNLAGPVTSTTEPAPSFPYQKWKLEGDRFLLDFAKKNESVRVAIVRAAKAVGPRDQLLVTPLLKEARTGKVRLPRGSERPMSFTGATDVSQALYRAATAERLPGNVYLVKSFDASPQELSRSILEATGMEAELKGVGPFGGKGPFDSYTASQIAASPTLGPQDSWKELGYAPIAGAKEVAASVAAWAKREPWAAGLE